MKTGMLIGRSVHIGLEVEVEVEVKAETEINKGKEKGKRRSRVQRGQGVCHHGIEDRIKLGKIELLR